MDFCVLIPYYNAFDDLVLSINSIRYDTSRYAILIVDDGSPLPLTPASLAGRIDSHVTFEIIHLPFNQGITRALNAGLTHLMSKNSFQYIARLDCGDKCAPGRFYEQVRFMDQHHDIDLLGTWCIFQNSSDASGYLYKTPTTHLAIRRDMHFRNVFIHPTVMWRKRALELYPEDFPHAEDYGLFYRQVKKIRCAILPQPLVTCQVNPGGLSLSNRRVQLNSRLAVILTMGESGFLVLLGALKIHVLKLLPFSLIFRLKKMMSYPIRPVHGT